MKKDLTKLDIKEIERLTKVKQTAKKHKDFGKTHTVMLIFTAHWADMCYYTYPMWYKFASKFATSKVEFYQVDITKNRELAELFNISA